MLATSIFLVEIRLKDWVAGVNRVVAYEEVLANDDYSARHIGYDQFVTRTKYEPVLRRKWALLGLTYGEVCAADSVQI